MRNLLVVLAIATLLLAACGGGGAAPASGGNSAAAQGEALFKQPVIGSQPGCTTCHTVDGKALVGPSLKGVASRAGQEVSGQSAEEYLKTSILDPNAHVVSGFTAGVMQSYEKDLSAQQLADLVAYLQTLK